MATFLAYTSPSLGNLFPIVALLCELRRRGHRIALRTHSAGVPVGQAAGLPTVTTDPRIEAVTMTDWTARTGLGAIRTGFAVFAERAAIEVDDLRQAVDAVAPDAVVIDTNCWGAQAMVQATGLPWATFWPYPTYLTSSAVPPFGLGLRPRHDLLGRGRDRAARMLVDRLFEQSVIEPVNRLHRGIGIPPLTSADDLVLRPPLVLIGTAEPFEYRRPDWDDRVALIGPCELPSAPGPAENRARPMVLVTTSSERQGDWDLPVLAMAALADLPVQVVATFPCGVPAGLPVPANARVHGFLDHGAVLDRAVCAVTHGGMGVTQKALARGVPVCVVPYGRDQFEVARRVEVAGCGTRLTGKRVNRRRLRNAVSAAMTMTAGARAVADGFAAAGGPVRGADLLERLLLGMPGG